MTVLWFAFEAWRLDKRFVAHNTNKKARLTVWWPGQSSHIRCRQLNS